MRRKMMMHALQRYAIKTISSARCHFDGRRTLRSFIILLLRHAFVDCSDKFLIFSMDTRAFVIPRPATNKYACYEHNAARDMPLLLFNLRYAAYHTESRLYSWQ